MARDPPLRGLRVLVTRPAHQADDFCAGLEREGARAIRFPAIAIGPPPDAAAVAAIAASLARFHLAIFISVNAV